MTALMNPAEADTYAVEGQVIAPGRAGIGGLFAEIVDRDVGRDVRLGQTLTDERGRYRVTFASPAKERPDLQARIWTRDGDDGMLLGESAVRYDASPYEVLDVELGPDATGLASEYEVLARALRSGFEGRLADLEESSQRQDVTYLAHKTGWDARAVAMAALADRCAGYGGGQIPAPLYYALFRAGLPADPGLLFRTHPRTVETVWRNAIAQEVVPASLEADLPQAVGAFTELSAEHGLGFRAVPGASSLDELLDREFPADPDGKRTFARLHLAHSQDPAAFWSEVEAAFGPSCAQRLHLDGQLASLSLNNAPLIGALQAAEEQDPGGGQLSDLTDLAQRGYFRAERWRPLVEGRVPDIVPGATPAAKAAAYADFLAAQVKLSSPTAVVAAKVRDGEMLSGTEPGTRDAVHSFLTEHQGQFELGAEPVERFIARSPDVAPPAHPEVLTQVKRIQRVYQLTPDDDAMRVLLDKGLDSATAIAAKNEDSFSETVAGDMGEADALAVHARARQISNAVLNVTSSFLLARMAPALGAAPGAPLLAALPATQDASTGVPAYPTLEGLFGSMNYEACEDCGSVLSPAAYLVDLLLFLEREVTPGGPDPQAVLLRRRPDIQNLPLTCENTNTALPAIDVVNETLEYFVSHGLSLTGYAGHDTGDHDSAELLADPQFTDAGVYDRLAAEFFPAPLPFHRSLETARRLFGQLGVPLQQAMVTLRQREDVDRPDAASYGWRDILMEELGLSRPEHRVLTDSTLTLQQVYGYAATTPQANVISEMSGVKAIAARVGVTYVEVVALLGTVFVNPGRSILLTKPAGGSGAGGFEELQLRHVDAGGAQSALGAIDLIRLIRFVRLWRKLGWSIEQTDAAISALYPAAAAPVAPDAPATLAPLDDGLRTTLLRLGVTVSVIRRLGLQPDKDLPSLLACWAPIGTQGPGSLYYQLFLTGTAERDPAFTADGTGAVLQDAGEHLLTHADGLRAAFGLTAEDLGLIVAGLGFDTSTPLTLPNVSAIYRRTWLARVLQVGYGEFLALTRLTGLDPFAVPEPPHPACTGLLDLLDALRTAGLTPATALDLFWNAGPGDTAAAQAQQAADLARALRGALTAIENELAVDESSPADRVQGLLALVYGPEAAEQFSGLLDGSLAVEVAYTQPQTSLDQSIIDASGARIGYDPARNRLSYAGFLSQQTRDALKAVAAAPPGFAAAVDGLFQASTTRSLRDAVFAASDTAIGALFTAYPALKPLLSAYAASANPPPAKRVALLGSVLPGVRADRERTAALALVAARTDPGLAEVILTDAAVLSDPGNTTQDALASLLALRAGGLSPATAPGGTPTTTLTGCFEVPEDGTYGFAVTADTSAVLTLTVDGAATPLTADPANPPTRTTAGPVTLKAGRLVPITLTVRGSTQAPVLSWRPGDRPWQQIPARYLYDQAALDSLRGAYIRFAKAAAIAGALKLTGGELAHLATDPDLRIGNGGWLAALPVSAGAPAPLLGALVAVLRFSLLKAALAPGDERLLTVLQNPAATGQDGASLLLGVTGWENGSLDTLLNRLGKTRGDLVHLDVFGRVYDANVLLSTLGISAASLIPATTNEPGATAIQTMQAALRARRGQLAWLDVVRSVNDPLRQLRRDALVALILRELPKNPATADVDTPDKLFEFFLMDVQMEPCMQTSRVQHAISAVQLFTERVLMNLDPEVPPSLVNRDQWEWMKRYRLWEANREVFLWPENWLEPELRDNQSSFFRQTMGELLQSDITDDSAATALLGYLSSLEEVAKLEPCAIHYVEGEPGTADDISHVVARTAGSQRRYYYRRRAFGTWTPWEQIPLDIEDNPIVPVVWNGRLLVFWLKVLGAAMPPQQGSQVDGLNMTSVTVGQVKGDGVKNVKLIPQAMLCWSEYYNGRWQQPKTSNANAPTSFGRAFDTSGEGAFARDLLVLGETTEGDALRVRIWGQGNGSSFLVYNTHSLPQRQEDRQQPPQPIDNFAELIREFHTSDATLQVTFTKDQVTPALRSIVTKNDGGLYQIISPFPVSYFSDAPQQSLIQDPWAAPFFYEDSRHVFYVSLDRPVPSPASASFGVSPPPPEALPIPPLTPLRDHDLPAAPAIRTLIDSPASLDFGSAAITSAGRSAPLAAASRPGKETNGE
jgi:Neuraminidase-like domain